MTSIPNTAKDFERWFEQHRAEWPVELQNLGTLAYRTLWQLDNNPPHVINQMEETKHPVWRSQMEALMAFAEAYGAWKAITHRSK